MAEQYNPMLLGSLPEDEGSPVNPLSLAGLGGAAAFQGMFPFAGEAAANSRGTTLPSLIGSGNSQFTGANAGRLTQGTQIVPQTQLVPSGQPPAVRPTGVPTTPGTNVTPSNASAARNIKMAERVRQLNLPNAAKVGRAGLNLSRLGSLLSPAALYTAADLGTEYFTGRGISERFGEAGGELLGEAIYGDGNLPAFSEEELAQIQQGSVASDADLPQMSRLGDEPLSFTQPTGPSSTTAQAAQLAATLPDDAGLMGAPGVQGTGIPTTTLDIDGGSATVPQALADQTFQGIGSAPMSIEETRARLGGRTLNEYLNAPNGTEGVYGLRTDPQGRMIPAGFDTRADAYGSYEMDAAAREARQDARPDFGAAISDRERRGTGEMSMADATDMFGSSEAGRAAILRQRQGLNPVTGNREKTDAERAQSEQQGQLQNEVLQARLDSFKQTDPDKLSKAQAYAERLGLTGDSATAFIFSQMGTSMDDIFGLEGTGAGGGGGSFTEAQQSSISKVMAANPGSSREQIIAEMKKQGKL